ncbi:hypothetical protein D3C72_1189750 [compost metagenome]
MPQPLHQIGAAVPRGALAGLFLIDGLFEEDEVPELERPAHIHRPADVGRPVGLPHRRHTMHEIRVERGQVGIVDLGVGRIRHGRIQVVAVLRHAFAHGTVERRLRIAADAGGRIGRDIGGVDAAQRRRHRQPAREGLAARRRVAGHAVAEPGQILAARDQRLVHRRGGLCGRRPERQQRGAEQRTRGFQLVHRFCAHVRAFS